MEKIRIPDVPMPVLPEVVLRGKSRFEIQEYGQNPSKGVVVIDDSRLINKIAYEVRKARPNYSSLLSYGVNQKLLEENKISEEAMREALTKLDGDMWQRYSIWAEFMDSLPEKRGDMFPKGKGWMTHSKDVSLYRGAKVVGELVYADDIEPVFLTLPKYSGPITEEWRNALGGGADTYHHPANLFYSKKVFKGLNALVWHFGSPGQPFLSSYRGPWDWNSKLGALLGSRSITDENVKKFQRPDSSHLYFWG